MSIKLCSLRIILLIIKTLKLYGNKELEERIGGLYCTIKYSLYS